MEKKSFQQGMAYLAAAYAAELSVERAAVYWDQFQRYPDAPFLRAVKCVVATDERFPTVARLREATAAELRKERHETPKIEHRKPVDQAKVMSFVQGLREKLRARA